MKNKILFLVPLPPPIYGAAVSSKLCLDSKVLNKKFSIKHVKLNYSQSLSDVGSLNKRKITGFFSVAKKIIKNNLTFKPDMIYFTIAPGGSGFIRDSIFVFLCKIFRKKIIFHLRGRIFHERKSPFRNILYKAVYRNSKAILINESFKEDLKGLVPDKNIFILPNAVQNKIKDIQLKQVYKKRLIKKTPNILFLSNMDETKGPFKLLQACKILNKKGIRFSCSFAGAWTDDRFRSKFENYIKDNHMQNVQHLGVKKENEKEKLFIRSDIMVFPTYYKYETFGLVVIEAMQYGLPVIANGIASIPSIIKDKETGFLLKRNTPEEIATHLEFLIKNKRKSIQMGRNGRTRFSEKYSFDKYEIKLKNVFLKTLNN